MLAYASALLSRFPLGGRAPSPLRVPVFVPWRWGWGQGGGRAVLVSSSALLVAGSGARESLSLFLKGDPLRP
ncbi:hypothetical protein NDU88_001318 [Pleurodeles waltl]|uniref:Uncharacterized protein n=1 Tax=Pleurodeles waltl TaxID=8319 RepID=A0AAV7WLT1_PLEWA|nr:hypothetical protein NDU88_001318 [Pleurodeles waltl]